MNEEACNQFYKKKKALFTKQLRKTMTPTELMLWDELRNRKFKQLKFRRQVNIGPYIVDFLCKQHRLIIEVDGGIHAEQKEYDQDRDAYLLEKGYYVLRVKNENVTQDISLVMNEIYDSIFFRQSSPSPVQ